MKLTTAMIAAIALCLGSVAARSHMMQASAEPALAGTPTERAELAAIDKHLHRNLHFFAQAIVLHGK